MRPQRWSTPPLGRHRRSRGRRASRGPEPRSRSRHLGASSGPGAGRSPARLSDAVGTGRADPAIGRAGSHLAGSDDGPRHARRRADPPADSRTEASHAPAPAPPPSRREPTRSPPAGVRPHPSSDDHRGRRDARHASRPSRRPGPPARRGRLTRPAHPDAPRAGPMRRAILIAAFALARASPHRQAPRRPDRLSALHTSAGRLQRLVRRSTCIWRGSLNATDFSGLRQRSRSRTDGVYARTCLVQRHDAVVNVDPFTVTIRVDKTRRP